MNNTVLLKGKGMGAAILFLALAETFEHSHYSQSKLKWWQSTTRYELRLQNLSAEEIVILQQGMNMNWPLTTAIAIEVF